MILNSQTKKLNFIIKISIKNEYHVHLILVVVMYIYDTMF